MLISATPSWTDCGSAASCRQLSGLLPPEPGSMPGHPASPAATRAALRSAGP